MKYPYAYLGVRKIFSSRILALIGGVALFIGTCLAIALTASLKGATESELASGGVLAVVSLAIILASSVLMIIAFIFNIIGLSKASNDEPSFRIALFAVLMNILVLGFGSMFSSMQNQFMASLMNAGSTVLDLAAFVFTIQGIRRIAVQLDDESMDSKGNTLFKVLLAVFTLEFIANLIVAIFGGHTASVIAAVIATVAAVLTIIEYILFLVYLGQAKKMLANAQ